jgi:hypothetical protein
MRMRACWAGLVVVLVAAPAAAQPDTIPPPTPTGVTVSAPALQPAGVVFKVTWDATLDPPGLQPVPVYRWSAGFNDGTGQVQGAVASPVLMLGLPYHASGATSGFVCILAEDAAGNVSPGVRCVTLAVPARPATEHTVEFREPATNADGTPLQDLVSIRVYWRVDGGPEAVAAYPASSPTGGDLRRVRLTVPATSGTLTITITAVDAAGNESPRSVPTTKVIRPTDQPARP